MSQMRIITGTEEEQKIPKRDGLKAIIRALYDLDEEFRLINLGIENAKDPDYLEYRQTIYELVKEYRATTTRKTDERHTKVKRQLDSSTGKKRANRRRKKS